MKRSSFFILACLFFSWMGYAQNDVLAKKKAKTPIITLNNQVKVNLATLLWGTGSVNYERKISNRWTVGLTANYRPKSTAPFKSYLQDIFGDEGKDYMDNAFDIDQLEYGNWSISPEVKIYLGESGAFKGFYIAGFVKYEDIAIDYDYTLVYSTQGQTIQSVLPLDGDLKAWTGGIYFGYQWQLGKKLYLDWQIIGGNFGGGSLDVSVYQALSQYEQDQIISFAKEIQDQLSDVEYEVNSQGARIWGNIPWAGLRTGLSIGFVF